MTTIGDESYFVKTEDSSIVDGKKYYIPTYNPVAYPEEESLTVYYEKNINNEYVLTQDSAIDTSKTYYILSSYSLVSEPTVANLSQYFEEIISG